MWFQEGGIRRRTIQLSGGLLVVLSTTVPVLSVSNAASASPSVDPIPAAIATGQLIVTQGPVAGWTTTQAAPGVGVKNALAPELEAYSNSIPNTGPATLSPSGSSVATAGVIPLIGVGYGTYHMSATGYVNITPPGGQKSDSQADFTSSVNCGGIITITCTIGGTSDEYWWGGSPVNYTTGGIVNTWWANGLAISASYPAGLGISGTSSSVSQTPMDRNNWYLNESFGGIGFSTYWVITSVDESAGIDQTFGAKNFFYPNLAQA